MQDEGYWRVELRAMLDEALFEMVRSVRHLGEAVDHAADECPELVENISAAKDHLIHGAFSLLDFVDEEGL